MHVFDPVFNSIDILVLKHFQMHVIEENEDGHRPVQRPTFFYMPHCEGVLYDSLLAANWTVSQLSRLAILGNSFRDYDDKWSLGGGAARNSGSIKPSKLLHLVASRAVQEIPVPEAGFHVPSAFNSMSLHVFPAGALSKAGLPP